MRNNRVRKPTVVETDSEKKEDLRGEVRRLNKEIRLLKRYNLRLRKQIFNISVKEQCDDCKYGWPSDLFDGEWMCNHPVEDTILYPDLNGTEMCPYYEKYQKLVVDIRVNNP